MSLGDVDTNTLVLFASVALQKCAFDNSLFWDLDGGNSGAQLGVVNGFHGSPDGANDEHVSMGDYAYFAKANGVGSDWFDIFFEEDGAEDDCPVSLVYGSSGAVRDEAWVDGGLADFHSTGSHTGLTYYFIDGCNPYYGPEL
jgi:hypothetical protein